MSQLYEVLVGVAAYVGLTRRGRAARGVAPAELRLQ